MPFTHAEILEAQKQVRPLRAWLPADESGIIRWRSALSIEGATVEGLFLHGRATASEPGRDVSFMLEHSPAGQKKRTIDRLDWRPITGHSNRMIGPAEFRLMIIEGSHRHSFYENLTSDGVLREGNLPIAVPILDPLETFGAFIAFVEKTYKVEGLGNLPAPDWTEDLFG